MASPATGTEADFGLAIAVAGGFGRFQRNLVLKMTPICVASIMGVNTMPYVMPAIVCEFSISKFQQGYLVAAVYVGMVIGGLIWGYVSDTIGRKKTLLIILTSTIITEILASMALNYVFLYVCRVCTGLTVCGFLIVTYVYTSEFTDAKNKDVMTMRTGTLVALGFLLQPLIAAVIIPYDIHLVVISGWIQLQSWSIFVLACLIFPLSGAIILFFMDESPQFLLESGRPEESLRILKKIYATNSRQPPNTFPISKIISNNMKKSKHAGHILPLFRYPYAIPVILTFLSQMITMAAFNSVKPYIPTLLALSLGIGQFNETSSSKATQTPFCVLFETQSIFLPKVKCDQSSLHLDPKLYFCSAIVGFAIFVSMFFSKIMVETHGKILTFILAHMISAMCMVIFPYAIAIFTTIILCIFSVCMQNCITISIGLLVGRVPPQMRGMSVALNMVFGRFGILIGSQLLPWISSISCISSFWVITLLHLSTVPLMMVFSKQPNPYEEDQKKFADEAESMKSGTKHTTASML